MSRQLLKAGALVLLVALLDPMPGVHAQDAARHPFFDKPMLMGAHRGGAKWRPEATAKTFTELARLWPEVMLECDVRMTKDGHIVVIHDGTVDRTTNGSGAIADLTLAEVQALDAGFRFTKDKATYPYRGQGYRVPTLAEALAVAPENNWLVEIKDQPNIDVESVIREIEKAGMVERVLLASFNPTYMTRARAANPTIARCFNSETRKGLTEALKSGAWEAYEPVDQVFSINYKRVEQYGLTEQDYAIIQTKGIPICAYTVNDTDAMTHLLSLGVMSMLTDFPNDLASQIVDWYRDHDKPELWHLNDLGYIDPL